MRITECFSLVCCQFSGQEYREHTCEEVEKKLSSFLVEDVMVAHQNDYYTIFSRLTRAMTTTAASDIITFFSSALLPNTRKLFKTQFSLLKMFI